MYFFPMEERKSLNVKLWNFNKLFILFGADDICVLVHCGLVD